MKLSEIQTLLGEDPYIDLLAAIRAAQEFEHANGLTGIEFVHNNK